MSNIKSPAKGEIHSTFRVGNHGESLLNIHHAVEAMTRRKKVQPQSKPSLLGINAEGETTVTLSNIRNEFRKVTGLMSRMNIDVVRIEDPFNHNFSALFTMSSEREKDIPILAMERIMVDGLPVWLQKHNKIAVVVPVSINAKSVKLTGYFECASDIPREMALGGMPSLHTRMRFNERFTGLPTLGEKEFPLPKIASAKGITEIIAGLSGPTDYLDIVSRAFGRRGEKLARLWRLDAPIRTVSDIAVSEIGALIFPLKSPRRIVTKNRKGESKQQFAFITSPTYEIGPEPELLIPRFGEPKP